jgi:hypothetical protein
MSVHIGFPSPATTQTLRYQHSHSSGLALEYIKYFSHIGMGSITKYTLSVPAAGNSPPLYSIQLSFSRPHHVLLCSAEYYYAEILAYKKHCGKIMCFKKHAYYTQRPFVLLLRQRNSGENISWFILRLSLSRLSSVELLFDDDW